MCECACAGREGVRTPLGARPMDALDAMLHRDGLDRAQVAMLGMQVKKGNKALAKADWTPECQAKLADVIKALD